MSDINLDFENNAFHQANETVQQKVVEAKEVANVTAPATLSFAVLNKKHPEYDLAQMNKLELLYNGGDELLRNAKLFLNKEPSETQRSYKVRLANAAYKNIFAQIVNDLDSHILSKAFNVTPIGDASKKSTPGDNIEGFAAEEFYKDFFNNCDLNGNSLIDFMSQFHRNALIQGKSFIGIDSKFQQQPVTLKAQQEIGADRLYLYHINNQNVYDYQLNDDGSFRYIKLGDCFPKETKLFEQSNQITYQFIWWFDTGNSVKCAKYVRDYDKDIKPTEQDLFKKVEELDVSFEKIPVQAQIIPKELWVGNLICNLVVDHFRMYSNLNSAVTKGLYPIPVVKLGPEVPEVDGALSQTQSNPNRGESAKAQLVNKGFIVLGSEDEFSYVEPEGKSYTVANQMLEAKQADIYSVINQMGQNAASKQSSANNKMQSGFSKQMDLYNKEIMLSCLGAFLKKALLNLYKDVSLFHQDNIIWQVIGLTDFKVIDRDTLIAEAVQMKEIIIPSKTFKKIYLKGIACELLSNLSSADELTIKDEIDKAVEAAPDELFSLEHENKEAEEEKDKSFNEGIINVQ